MSIESVQTDGSLPERALKTTASELWTSTKHILTPPPYKQQLGLWNNAGNTAGEMMGNALFESVRLPSVLIGSIMKTTLGAVGKVLGGTVKLTGKALLSLPIVPMPPSRH